MAVVDRNNAVANSNDKKKFDAVEIDLDKILLLHKEGAGEKVDIDATEDAWERSAPITPGRYSLIPYLGKDKPKMDFYDRETKKKPYFGLALECKVQHTDPDINGITVFARVSTRINRGKSISTVLGLIKKLGFNLPAKTSDAEQVALLNAALKKEKVIDVEVDWKASFKDLDDRGNEVWKNICNSYDDFPDSPDGGKEFIVKVTKRDSSRDEVRAQLNIVHWYDKGEEDIKKKKEGKGVGAGNKGNSGPMLLDEAGDGMPLINANAVSDAPKEVKEAKKEKKEKEKEAPKDDDDALAALLGNDE